MSKYQLNEACDWCGDKPAHPYIVEKRGTLTKRYKIEVMACDPCSRRMDLASPA